MNSWPRTRKLIFVSFRLLLILILLPAILFGVAQRWEVIFLLNAYMIFSLGTIWRGFKYGKLSKTNEDEQYKRPAGRLALSVQFIGLLAVHWLAIYQFSQNKTLVNTPENIGFTTLGVFAIAIAIIINQVAINTLKALFDRMTIKPDHQLITIGIYRFLRHPIYLSYILLFTGFCTILYSNIIIFVLLAFVCAIWLGNRIAIEEEMLIARFGEQYKAYQRKTKMLFPFIY